MTAAAKLAGIGMSTLDAVIAGFTAADWCQLETEHLDITGYDMFAGLEAMGLDMDDDPIGVFCRLYMAARAVDYYPRCQTGHPEFHGLSLVVA